MASKDRAELLRRVREKMLQKKATNISRWEAMIREVTRKLEERGDSRYLQDEDSDG